ncbi:MAG TPA: PLP-dependent aminotransferase family protein [Stellaceae bacterium]|jgi:2-aminoadipate transaminase|nr:PLP-dependent aminotransferase family protein [Stellaceae bacterium]
MAADGFAYTNLFANDLPAPAPRWTGFPKYNFIGGHNDPEHVPAAELAAAAEAVLRRDGADLALYNPHGPQGFRGIREFVVNKVAARGIRCTPDDVLITSGSGQGLDLVNRTLLNRGDTVILEEFTYGGALTKLQRLGVNVVGAPLDDDGLKIDALDQILGELKRKGVVPKFVYTIPTVQNPTGSILPVARREGLLGLAKKHGVVIFEDECYADLTWSPDAPPAIYSMDPSQVVHVGSFSKTLSPALRLGYVVADWAVMSRLVGLKRETDSGTGALEQMVVAEYFSRKFEEHVGELTGVLKEKLDTMVEALEREFGTAVEKMWRPKGGIFLWIKLPDQVDVTRLVAPAAKEGLVFNPGPEWSCNPAETKSHMRLCFALPSKEVIRDGVATLARVCYEETGIPEQSANIRRTSS